MRSNSSHDFNPVSAKREGKHPLQPTSSLAQTFQQQLNRAPNGANRCDAGQDAIERLTCFPSMLHDQILPESQLPFLELTRRLETLKLAQLGTPEDMTTHPTEIRLSNVQSVDMPQNGYENSDLGTTSVPDLQLLDNIRASTGNHLDDYVVSNEQLGSIGLPDHGQMLVTYTTTMLPLLESLFRRGDVQRLIPDSSADTEEQQQQQSSAQLQFLVYAASNNFAGCSAPNLTVMYSYLKEILHLVPSSSNALTRGFHLLDIPSAKPMAETFFRCAIEAGDDKAVRSLLLWQNAGISPNDQVCDIEGARYTPVERAAVLQHLMVTMALIEFGADVNKTHSHDRNHGAYKNLPCGALEHAIQGGPCRDQGAKMELLKFILRSGGNLGCRCLKGTLSREPTEVVRLLLFSTIREHHHQYTEKAVFHEAIHCCASGLVQDLIREMPLIGADMNSSFVDLTDNDFKRNGLPVWFIARFPPKIIDVAAQRGDIKIVKLLQSCSAVIAENTLTAAIRSQNIDLVLYLLNQ